MMKAMAEPGHAFMQNQEYEIQVNQAEEMWG